MLKGALGEGESERKARRLREREGESERRREKQGEDTANEVEKGTKRRLKKVVLLKKNLKTPGEITALKNVRERKRERDQFREIVLLFIQIMCILHQGLVFQCVRITGGRG